MFVLFLVEEANEDFLPTSPQGEHLLHVTKRTIVEPPHALDVVEALATQTLESILRKFHILLTDTAVLLQTQVQNRLRFVSHVFGSHHARFN